MSKRSWLIFAAIVFILFTASHGLLAGILATAVFTGFPYVAWSVLFPRTRHTGFRSCNGTGEVRSRLFPWSHRRCRTCSNGRIIRLGARLFGPAYLGREHRAMVTSRRTARQENRWR